MVSIEEHVGKLKQESRIIGENCPWLNQRDTEGEYVKYGDKGALCTPAEKVLAGRAAASAYQMVRHLEFDHLNQCKDALRDQLSRRRNLPEETGGFLAKDLFEKCEAITSCIACSCGMAVSAYHNLENLANILTSPPAGS
jgi:hypothetical protein